ncbi:MAG TPA: alpha/beta fold hydrolase [Chloroflexota bacterium]|nr:alpha/beta fold hydrolase [Chloroflexota bacterium]
MNTIVLMIHPRWRWLLFLLWIGFWHTACVTVGTPVVTTPTAVAHTRTPTTQPHTAVATPPPTHTATAVATATPMPPTINPPTPAPPTPAPTVTPDLLSAYTLDGLRERNYPPGQIRIQAVLTETATFTRHYIAYPSDGLTITGIMQTPPGAGPFPVIIMLHGYYDRKDYWSGWGTWQAAEYLNARGYLTIAPDLRSWGQSDVGLSLFHTGLVVDVLNLLSALPSLPQADTNRVGLWGHSMGGGIITKVLVVDDRVQAAVLYAPNSADDADLVSRWGPGCLPEQSEPEGDRCNPGEVIPPDLAAEVVAAYRETAVNPTALQRFAPYYHLSHITAPVQIHVGLADGQEWVETPPEWSDKLYAALQAAGKEATLYQYDDQGHFFYDMGWTLFMERVAAFFDEKVARPSPDE